MLSSYNCIFAQGYCSYTTLNSIVSQLQSRKELTLILTHRMVPTILCVSSLIIKCGVILYTRDTVSQSTSYHSLIGLRYSNQKDVSKLI